ncbi:MAG: hypothetical protein LBJ11_10095 [Oscillospiraceae bacterium]|jgi:hypothetical protein|nr:hypothetical protein [Oscillospiraceae bacterium]
MHVISPFLCFVGYHHSTIAAKTQAFFDEKRPKSCRPFRFGGASDFVVENPLLFWPKFAILRRSNGQRRSKVEQHGRKEELMYDARATH